MNKPPKLIMAFLAPFLATRQIYCGAGKIGSENGTDAVDYQISQRSDFFETIVGGQTTFCRPIVNSRDEPHADRTRFRRLHNIVSDANMSEYATFLKIGTMQLVLRMLEDNFLQDGPELENPVAAMVDISHDITCRKQVKLVDGRRLTPVEIQRFFLEAAEDYCFSDRYKPDEMTLAVLREWRLVLDDLAEDPNRLYRKIDWVIKKWLIERMKGKRNLTWRDARLRRMDIQYHDIDRARGLYYILQNEGQVDRLFEDDHLIRHYIKSPPADTRAFFRSRCINLFSSDVVMANWDIITFRTKDGLNHAVPLHDPGKGTKMHVGDLLKNTQNIQALLDNLQSEEPVVTSAAV